MLQFMEQESASTLLQFWLTAENFYNHLSSPEHTPNIEEDTRDAIAIYDRFRVQIIFVLLRVLLVCYQVAG